MSNYHIKATAAAAVLGPVALLASTLAYAGQGDGMNNGEVGGAIQVWAFIALTVAVVGLARLLEASAPRAAVVITVLGLAGLAAGAGYGIDSMHAEVSKAESLQEVDSLAPIALNIPGLMWPLGLIVLGVMLARAGAVPSVLAYGVVAFGVLFPASRIPDVVGLAVVADVVGVLALGGIGLHLLGAPARMTSVTTP